MEEFSIEKKAKAYDEAKKLIKDNLDALNEIIETGAEVVSIQSIKNCFYIAFPELCESEDEKIRKGIISGMKALQEKGKCTYFANIPMDKVFAWLEKQGTSYTKRDVDDAFVEGMALAKNELKKQGEQKSVGDEIVEALHAEYEKGRAEAFAQMQKEWSEEDEYIIEEIEAIIDAYVLEEYNPKALKNWLKSLKERYTWKPSDAQMHYLSWIANVKLGDGVVEQEVSKHLNELLKDLKKLKGE